MISLQDDKLNRDVFLNDLFGIFLNYGNQDGQGLTIAINGKYGSGKTTLLSFIKEKNEAEDNNFNIVTYDAWESNFFDNPLIPLMYTISKISSTGDKVKKVAKQVVKTIPKMFFQSLANFTNVDLTALMDNYDVFKEYDDFNKAVKECKCVLEKVCEEKKTILLVDELDRCLPVYQIKVLESLYHFFNIPNLIIVVAIDRDQLEEAIRSEFGTYTDVLGYLSKFVQYEIDLPNDSIGGYAMSLLAFKSDYDLEVKEIISSMIQSLNVSTRDLKSVVQHINVICKEQRDGFGMIKSYIYFYPIIVSFLVLLRKYSQSVYNKYFGKELLNDYDEKVNPIEKTRFYTFTKDVKDTQFNSIFEAINATPLGQSAMLHIIGLFDNLSKISITDLSKLIFRTEDDTESLLRDARFINWYFPSSVNSLIKQLKLLK